MKRFKEAFLLGLALFTGTYIFWLAVHENVRREKALYRYALEGRPLLCYDRYYVFFPEVVERNKVLYVKDRNGKLYRLRFCSFP